MNTIKSIIFSLSSLFLLSSQSLHACSDYPSGEYTRVGSFFQFPSGMNPYMPFIYTFDLYYSTNSDPLRADREMILQEWQKETGNSVQIKDIEVILYQVTPNTFLLPYYFNKLNIAFEGNTFVDFLVKPENKAFLDYVEIMKQMEYIEFYLNDPWRNNNSWGADGDEGAQDNLFSFFCNQYIKNCENQLKGNQNDFLNERLNFQLAKMYLKTERYSDCENIIDPYLKNGRKGFLQNAMYHYLGVCKLAKGDTAMANLCFARSFRLANERKFRNVQLFRTSRELTEKSILLTANKSEKALLLALSALRNPGHALEQLKKIAQFDPNIPEFMFLIYREVNKFDDWIASPTYANQSPSITSFILDTDGEPVSNYNLKNDKQYLAEFLTWFSQIRPQFKGESKQYLDLAYVHLNLLNGNLAEATTCFQSLNVSATDNYYDQYLAEKIYLKILSPDFSTNANLNSICLMMKGLEDKARHDILMAKMLSTLNQILAYRINQTNRKCYVGLIRLKSDVYAGMNEYSYFSVGKSEDYNLISWYDKNNSVDALDTLIALKQNTNKEFFQTFFTDSILGSTDLYRDLKGTIAFRSGNLKLANTVFLEMDPTFWNQEKYKSNLRENPFIPKYWPMKRTYDYQFNKAEFTSQLLALKEETNSKNAEQAAAAWLKLGHGYYNSTYWGNAWMMSEYSWSTYFSSYSNTDPMPNYGKAYYYCDEARNCYLKVINLTKNIELKAVGTFMLHACDMNKAIADYNMLDYDRRPDKLKYQTQWLNNFKQYKGTTVYREYLSNCSYLNEYLKKGYLNL